MTLINFKTGFNISILQINRSEILLNVIKPEVQLASPKEDKSLILHQQQGTSKFQRFLNIGKNGPLKPMKNSKKLARPPMLSGRSRNLMQGTPGDPQSFSKSMTRSSSQPLSMQSASLLTLSTPSQLEVLVWTSVLL